MEETGQIAQLPEAEGCLQPQDAADNSQGADLGFGTSQPQSWPLTGADRWGRGGGSMWVRFCPWGEVESLGEDQERSDGVRAWMSCSPVIQPFLSFLVATTVDSRVPFPFHCA